MELIAKVKEVFLTENDNEIGFKVEIDDEIIKIIEEQNEDNIKIYKDDLVMVRKTIIQDKIFYDIDLIEGGYDGFI